MALDVATCRLEGAVLQKKRNGDHTALTDGRDSDQPKDDEAQRWR